jgi:hypothetical protein
LETGNDIVSNKEQGNSLCKKNKTKKIVSPDYLQKRNKTIYSKVSFERNKFRKCKKWMMRKHNTA